MEQFKANLSEKPESQSSLEENGIVYQFNYRPEQARLEQTARVSELEGRLHRLEKVIGASDEKLSRLSSVTSKGSLLEAAEHLSATATLLDSTQLDHIEGRLSALLQKLEAISEKKKQSEQDEEKNKMVGWRSLLMMCFECDFIYRFWNCTSWLKIVRMLRNYCLRR